MDHYSPIAYDCCVVHIRNGCVVVMRSLVKKIESSPAFVLIVPFVQVCDSLDLRYPFVFKQSRGLHDHQQPAWQILPVGSPELRQVLVHRHHLARKGYYQRQGHWLQLILFFLLILAYFTSLLNLVLILENVVNRWHYVDLVLNSVKILLLNKHPAGCRFLELFSRVDSARDHLVQCHVYSLWKYALFFGKVWGL